MKGLLLRSYAAYLSKITAFCRLDKHWARLNLAAPAIQPDKFYLALRMADRGLVSAPNAAAGLPYNIGLQPQGLYPLNGDTTAAPKHD